MDEGSHTPTILAIIPVHGVRLGDIPSVHRATKRLSLFLFWFVAISWFFIV